MDSEFHAEEDDKKFVVAVTGCNNGGRLIRDGIAKQQNASQRKLIHGVLAEWVFLITVFMPLFLTKYLRNWA
jgi:hypothetical protein